MTCFLCKCNMEKSTTIYTAQLNKNCILLVKNVPCMKCNQCGEVWFSGTVVEKLESIMNTLENTFTEIAIVNCNEKVA